MNYDLIELAKSCPDLTISVRLSDLVEANRGLIEERDLPDSRKGDGNAGGRSIDPLALGEMRLPHPYIHRHKETVPPVGHP